MTETDWVGPLTLKNEPEIADLLGEIHAITEPGELKPGTPYAWHLVMRTAGDNNAFARHCGLSRQARPYECVWIPWLGNFTLEEAPGRLQASAEQLLKGYRDADIPGLMIETKGTFCRTLPALS